MNTLIYVMVGGLVGLMVTVIVQKKELLDVLFNISLGVIGAFVAGWIFTPLFGIRSVEPTVFSVTAMFVSLGGAALLLMAVNLYRWRAGQSAP